MSHANRHDKRVTIGRRFKINISDSDQRTGEIVEIVRAPSTLPGTYLCRCQEDGKSEGNLTSRYIAPSNLIDDRPQATSVEPGSVEELTAGLEALADALAVVERALAEMASTLDRRTRAEEDADD